MNENRVRICLFSPTGPDPTKHNKLLALTKILFPPQVVNLFHFGVQGIENHLRIYLIGQLEVQTI